MRRTIGWGGAAALAVLALTGCVRTTVDTTITSDDTFSQHSIVAFNDSVAAQVGDQAGVEVTNLREQLEASPEFVELQELYPGQVEVVDYDDGELQGIELTVTDLPIDEFNAATAQAGTGLTGGATLSRVDDTFVVEMTLPQDANLEELGVTESQLNLLAGSLDIGVSYTFPGPIESTTAGVIDGHTVTLGLTDIVSGDDIRIVASAGDQVNWGPILTWGGVVLAFVLVIGGAIALIVQDRRKSLRNTLPPHQATDTPTGPGVLGEPTAQGEPTAEGDPRIGDTDSDDPTQQ